MRRKKPKMNVKPQVSIIVPVFNGEKYLSQCIDSVLAQRYTDWELLLIDDGSTDGAAALCDSYAADPRIVVVHQPNSGAAAARNKGIAMARGEWVAFVDSDDYIEKNAYSTMMEVMSREGADIVECAFSFKFRDKETEEYFQNMQILKRMELLLHLTKSSEAFLKRNYFS